MDYAKLSEIPAHVQSRKYLGLRKFLFGNRLAQFISANAVLVQSVQRSEEKTRRSIGLANESGESAAEFGSGFGYEDELHELAIAFRYKKEIESGFKLPSDSRLLYEHAERVLSQLINTHRTGRPVRQVLNFGVSYAYTDNMLAAVFPDVQFIGVDRSRLTKAMNETEFPNSPNLQFVASDVFDVLKAGAFADGCLWHMRTALLLPKPFLKSLYAAAAKAGIRHICLFEPIGISRQTLRPYQFSESEKPSVALRDGFFIHNYPHLLKEAGFAVERAELVATGHPHPDIRILSITATNPTLSSART